MRITDRVRAFIGHHLVRKTLTLQIGGVLGTLIQALAGVLMARILQPERYGIYALAFSVASISSVFIGGGIIDAITPAISRAWARRDQGELKSTLGFYFRFLAACAAVTAVVLIFLPTITGHLYHNADVGRYAIIIVLASIVSVSVFALVQLILQVAGRIRTMAALSLADVVARYGAMLALSLAGFGIWGAVFGHLIGAAVLLVVALVLYMRLERTEPLVPMVRQWMSAIRQSSWQPLLRPTLWVLADSNFALLYGAFPIAMVGLYATGTELAYFKLAFGYLILAMSAMGSVSVVMNVHFPTLQTTAPDQLRAAFVRVTAVAVALSTAITAVVLAIAPLVFRILYGPVYAPAVSYVYGFAVFGALFGLGVGLGPMWRAVGKVHVSIIINVITLGLGVPLGLVMIHFWHLWGAVAMVTAWYTLSHLASFLYLLRALKSEA